MTTRPNRATSRSTGSEPDAVSYSLKLLSCRGRSVRELRGRLREKGYDDGAVEAAIAHLSSAGFLDDVLLARNLKRIASEQRMMGSRGTRQLLRRRGIGEDVINDVLVPDDAEDLDACIRLARKRTRVTGMPRTRQESMRLLQYLARRGHSAGTIRRAMKELGREIED